MKTPSRSKQALRSLVAAATFVLAAFSGCGNDSLAPFQPEIHNQADTFQLQATDVQRVTTTLTYDWTNTGVTANVNQASTARAGSATLRILDAAAVEVYRRDLVENGTFATSAGTSGTWRIELQLQGFSGTLNVRVQKP